MRDTGHEHPAGDAPLDGPAWSAPDGVRAAPPPADRGSPARPPSRPEVRRLSDPAAEAPSRRTLRLLTFSTLYPSAARPNHGVFVENRLRHLVAGGEAESTVLAPVP